MLTNVIDSLFMCVQDRAQENLRSSSTFFSTVSWEKGKAGVVWGWCWAGVGLVLGWDGARMQDRKSVV